MNRNSDKSLFTRYFADLWAGISTTFKGMKLTMTYFVSRPAITMQYPEVKPVIAPNHRGLHAYDEEKCILCMMCVNNCPVNCITIESMGKGKDGLVTRYDVDYSRCLFCNICAEVCPTSCVWLTERFNLAGGSRKATLLHFARPKTDEDIKAYEAKMAQKEIEKKKLLEEAEKKKQAEAQTAAEKKKQEDSTAS